MALDIITASQADTYAIIQQNIVFPDPMSLLMPRVYDPQHRGFNKSVVRITGLLMKKKNIYIYIYVYMCVYIYVTCFGDQHVNLCFMLHVPVPLLWYLPPVQPDSH